MSDPDTFDNGAQVPTVDPPPDGIDAGSAGVPVDDPGDGSELPRERGDVVIALSPGQILGGFALLAGLIVMVRRRRRKQD